VIHCSYDLYLPPKAQFCIVTGDASGRNAVTSMGCGLGNDYSWSSLEQSDLLIQILTALKVTARLLSNQPIYVTTDAFTCCRLDRVMRMDSGASHLNSGIFEG